MLYACVIVSEGLKVSSVLKTQSSRGERGTWLKADHTFSSGSSATVSVAHGTLIHLLSYCEFYGPNSLPLPLPRTIS